MDTGWLNVQASGGLINSNFQVAFATVKVEDFAQGGKAPYTYGSLWPLTSYAQIWGFDFSSMKLTNTRPMILGIECRMSGAWTGYNLSNNYTLRLIYVTGGVPTIIGNEKAFGSIGGSPWTKTVGGPNDLWGLTSDYILSRLNGNLGVYFGFNNIPTYLDVTSVDYCQLKIYYSNFMFID